MGDFDFADLHHALFAGFLFFEEFSFSRDVAAVAFGEDVFSDGIDGFASDDFSADGALDGDFELLASERFAESFANEPGAFDGAIFVDEDAEGVDGFVIDEDGQFSEFCLSVFEKFVVERGVAFGDGFEFVVEIEEDFAEGKFEDEFDASRIEVAHIGLVSASGDAQVDDGADIRLGDDEGRLDEGFFGFGNHRGIGVVEGVVDFDDIAVSQSNFVFDARRGENDALIVFAFESFLRNFEMK